MGIMVLVGDWRVVSMWQMTWSVKGAVLTGSSCFGVWVSGLSGLGAENVYA